LLEVVWRTLVVVNLTIAVDGDALGRDRSTLDWFRRPLAFGRDRMDLVRPPLATVRDVIALARSRLAAGIKDLHAGSTRLASLSPRLRGTRFHLQSTSLRL
jgi:hypothetical protein